MPTETFWILVGFGCAFAGWGVMKFFVAKAYDIERRSIKDTDKDNIGMSDSF